MRSPQRSGAVGFGVVAQTVALSTAFGGYALALAAVTGTAALIFRSARR